MRSVTILALKDLRLLTRDKLGLFWIFVFPLLFGLFFGVIFGGRGGSNRIPVAIVDEDDSEVSRAFVARLEKSSALQTEKLDLAIARERVLDGKLTAYIHLKAGYGESGGFGPDEVIEVGIDPSRQAEAGMLQGVLAEANFEGFADSEEMAANVERGRAATENNRKITPEDREKLRGLFDTLDELRLRLDQLPAADGKKGKFQGFQVKTVAVAADQAKPRSSFEITFPASILWGIMGCSAAFAISIVNERVAGTLFRLKVSTASWMDILAGKALACFVMSCSVVIVLLALGWLIFGIRIENLPGLGLAIVSTALCFTGLMMLLCTIGRTEQSVAGAGWGLISLFAMIGGGMVPLFVMPEWMQKVSLISPVSWGIQSLEGAIWRGYTLGKFLLPCGVLLAIGAVGFTAGVAIIRWRER